MVDGAKMPVLEFTSQIRGGTARVWVFHDRVEWFRRRGPGILARGVLAGATEGASEEFGGGTGDGETESVPIDEISSIAAQRVGMHIRLSIVTRGRTIDMDVSPLRAARVQEVLRGLISPEPPARP